MGTLACRQRQPRATPVQGCRRRLASAREAIGTLGPTLYSGVGLPLDGRILSMPTAFHAIDRKPHGSLPIEFLLGGLAYFVTRLDSLGALAAAARGQAQARRRGHYGMPVQLERLRGLCKV